jgi:hypothetical protein
MAKKRFNGRRVNIYLPPKQEEVADQIENLSNFIQICLNMASDIMAWDILHNMDPEKYTVKHKKPIEEIFSEFNEKNPLDPLTKRRLQRKEWRQNSQKIPEILS